MRCGGQSAAATTASAPSITRRTSSADSMRATTGTYSSRESYARSSRPAACALLAPMSHSAQSTCRLRLLSSTASKSTPTIAPTPQVASASAVHDPSPPMPSTHTARPVAELRVGPRHALRQALAEVGQLAVEALERPCIEAGRSAAASSTTPRATSSARHFRSAATAQTSSAVRVPSARRAAAPPVGRRPRPGGPHPPLPQEEQIPSLVRRSPSRPPGGDARALSVPGRPIAWSCISRPSWC